MATKRRSLAASPGVLRLGVLLSVLLAAACGPPAASGPGQPSGVGTSATVPGANTGTSPVAPGTSAGPTASGAEWEQQWNQLVAAAKAEGKVVVYGPPTAETRDQLSATFEKRFGIPLEYLAVAGGDAATRVVSEHGAGVYTADAIIAGADSMFRFLAASGQVEKDTMGVLAPLRPALFLPEVTEPSRYRNGKLWFVDPEDRFILRIVNFVYTPVFLNTNHVRVSDIMSWSDLLKPEYQGKIAGADPTNVGSGPGLPTASFLYVTQGEQYLRDFYFGQQPFLNTNFRVLADHLASGAHPIVYSLQTQEYVRVVEDGFPVAEAANVPGYSSAGYGFLGLLNRAPHPNAAKLFLNWIATREALQIYQDTQGYPSTRNDVDHSRMRPTIFQRAGVEYFDTAAWDWVLEHRPVTERKVRELLVRR
jgi:iron(III) transport system substrate-binding protein